MANYTLAYGFVQWSHLAAERVATVGFERVWTMIQESADEHTRQINALMASLVERTTLYKERYMLPGSGTLQPLDENGNPRPVRPSGYMDVAYPIQGGGTAWGDNRVSRAKLTVDEANRNTLDALRKDADWVRRHIFSALFYGASWTYTDPLYGSLTIECLADNGAGELYPKAGVDAAVDNHLLAQAAAIDNSNDPFDDIYDELTEHPSNAGGPVVVYIPTNLKASVEALTSFVEVVDPDLRVGSATEVIGASFDRGFGDEVLGKSHKCWIVEWKALPDSYMFAHAQGGGPVLKVREHEESELQGFFAEGFDTDGNFKGTRMIRYAGFGVANRIAAVAYYVGAGSYTAPTDYDSAPLPV